MCLLSNNGAASLMFAALPHSIYTRLCVKLLCRSGKMGVKLLSLMEHRLARGLNSVQFMKPTGGSCFLKNGQELTCLLLFSSDLSRSL